MTDRYQASTEAISPLTPRRYRFTQERSVEPPFNHDFWDVKDAGIYIDVVFGEPLFASTKK